MDTRELKRAVIRGAKFLDLRDPDWWKNDTTPNGINIESLDLGSPKYCVLGQRYREDDKGYKYGFDIGTEKYDLTSNDTYRLGFDVDTYHISENKTASEYYSLLTELWIDVINARRHPRRKHPEWLKPVLKPKSQISA